MNKIVYVDRPYQPSQPNLNVIFIIRPDLSSIKRTVSHIKSCLSIPDSTNASTKRLMHVYLVPRKSLVSQHVFETEGVLGDIVLGEFRFDLMPLDKDVVSLELQGTFKELYMVYPS